MNAAQIRNELDKLIETTETYNKAKIPAALLNNVNKWRWGSYGWVSPASLMFTAAWRKYYYPEVDCCKIWASDENNHPIPGGYSIRSEDEAISIPLLAKYDLCDGFCLLTLECKVVVPSRKCVHSKGLTAISILRRERCLT